MIYRETGQFKATYASDQQLFPILQDRVFVIGFLVFAFFVVPFVGTEYLFRAILVPFLILSLAALGLNILVGYCGQVSLGTGAFMAVGAYSAYNLALRVPDLNLLVVFLLAGVFATVVGVLFGIPSLRLGRRPTAHDLRLPRRHADREVPARARDHVPLRPHRA